MTARRVILWAALGTVLFVATHGLRNRIRRAREQAAQLQDRLREISTIEDRDRIAGDLPDKVIKEIFAAGLSLQSAAMPTTDQHVRRQIEKSVGDLDHAVLKIRDTVYGLEHRLEGRGLRAEILRRCGELHVALETELHRAGRRRAAPRRQGRVGGAAAGRPEPDQPAFRPDSRRDHRQP